MVEKNSIPFSLPDINKDEISEVVDCLKSGWITTGPKTDQFENEFKKYIESEFALAVNSGTSGLHLALAAINVSEGDAVITTTNTFAATAEVIRYQNATPIFIDIDERTQNIDCNKIIEFIEKECAFKNGRLFYQDSVVKAIIPVHIGGYPCEMDSIVSIAKKYNLKVIEDAAHALPTKYNGKLIGTIGDITVFSFYATKPITTAEGGMITTDNSEFYERMKILRLHGIDRDVWDRYSSTQSSWYYEIVAPGYKYNLPDVLSAIGIHQLKKVDIFYRRRREIAEYYIDAFKDLPFIELPEYDLDKHQHAWHLFIIKIKKNNYFNRDDLHKYLASKQIGTSVHFIPLHMHPYYKKQYGYKSSDFPVAEKNFYEILSLPIYSKMSDGQVEYVVDQIKNFVKKYA